MASDHIPRHPVGHKPGKEFVDTGDPMGIKVGIITRVDEINLKADIHVLTGGGDRFEIDLTQALCGPRSFWGGVPEVNSVVIIGYRRRHKQLSEAVILGYIPTGNRLGFRFDPYAPVDPSTIDPADATLVQQIYGSPFRVRRLKLRPGDVGGMSSSGSELVLSKDVRIYNRAGDFFELRDTDRTWVGQSVHRVENESGVTRISGPVRRGGFYTYPDILQTAGQVNVTGVATATVAPAPPAATALPGVPPPPPVLQTPVNRYFGTAVYQASGPGFPGGANRFSDLKGNLLNVFNSSEFPSVTYSNGRQVYYSSTFPGVSMEDPTNGAGAEAFVEYRIELDHTSDLSQKVLEEIDGFAPNARRKYIEHVMGTTVGNDTTSSEGMRNYNRPTKPKMFDDFTAFNEVAFTMEECARTPLEDLEVFTMAGAYLLAIHPARTISDDYFACAINKQGKVFLNVPGSSFEQYSDGAKNVSVEANFLGAIKANIGMSTPSKQSINVNCAGGITANVGSNSEGRAIDITYHSSVQASYTGTPDTDNVALTEDVQGNKQTYCSGASTENVKGMKTTSVNGGYQIFADRFSIAGSSGVGISASDMSMTIAGKTQYNYALAVLENIVAGGKVVTVLGGALATTVAAGAIVTTAGGGAITETSGADFTLTAGAALSFTSGGGMTQTVGGALSVTAGGALAITAGATATVTAAAAVSLVGAQILLGGPAAVYGIARGIPMMPPGSPSLDWITGLPLQGCAVSRSF